MIMVMKDMCSIELWPNDPNFTNGSLLQFFWTLKTTPIFESKILFEHPPNNTFFTHLLQGKSQCTCELKTPSQVFGPKPLLKKLLFQMDDYVTNNKKWYLLTILSLLIMKEVFEEVKLGFLVVGHTHEDIDGCFRYLSKKLKKQNN